MRMTCVLHETDKITMWRTHAASSSLPVESRDVPFFYAAAVGTGNAMDELRSWYLNRGFMEPDAVALVPW